MTVKMIVGDCRDVLKTLPSDSIHCVVTSPPYWGLRDYGTAKWEGGDPGCDHISGLDKPRSSRPLSAFHGGDDKFHVTPFRDICGKCGARRIDSQIGLEPTYQAFIAEMVAVFREVRRVLRPDGTCWVNLGDSYAGSFGAQSKREGEVCQAINLDRFGSGKSLTRKPELFGLKPKDLCGIPWRVALALQEDGWWLRQDLIWSKPNPMPESVTDRCTKAHEYLFLLTKSPRYYYDSAAIQEPFTYSGDVRMKTAYAVETGKSVGTGYREPVNQSGRNRRSVWEIATSPFPEAHFATFPPALVEPCIKAGTSEKGCCGKCGAPWVRMQKRIGPNGRTIVVAASERHARDAEGRPLMGDNMIEYGVRGSFNVGDKGTAKRTDAGWQPTCKCNAAVVPATVLDPFGGAGTTGLVADRQGRDGILIELNPQYAAMAEKRIFSDAPLFNWSGNGEAGKGGEALSGEGHAAEADRGRGEAEDQARPQGGAGAPLFADPSGR